MRSLVRTISAIALAALVALVAAGCRLRQEAQGQRPGPKQVPPDGLLEAPRTPTRTALKNFAEFKLGTNPRKADTDKDGLKDGDEVESANDPLDA